MIRAIHAYRFAAPLLLGVPMLLAQTISRPDASIVRRVVTIPMAEAGPGGLTGWLVLPNLPGKHPLVLLSPYVPHDSLRSIREMGPGSMQREALWFVRRGWAVAIVMRRGMGANGGQLHDKPESCSKDLFERQEAQGIPDLQAAYKFMSAQPEVDASRTIAVGSFEGGVMSIWLAKNPPPDLKAVLNFRGGWENDPGWLGGTKCIRDAIVPAFSELGTTAHIPMLWIYPKNDHFFGTAAAMAAQKAFNDAGGHAQLELITKYSKDDMYPFYEDPAEWGPLVEKFLQQLDLPATELIPADSLTAFNFPDRFPDNAKQAYLRFLQLGDYKAFALSRAGAWGYSSGRLSQDIANKRALASCPDSCTIIFATGRSAP
jgi:dienelactone hydrolase